MHTLIEQLLTYINACINIMILACIKSLVSYSIFMFVMLLFSPFNVPHHFPAECSSSVIDLPRVKTPNFPGRRARKNQF